MFKSGDIATLPPSARIAFMRDAWLREKQMRMRVLKGGNREDKVTEADTCLDYLNHVDQALTRAKEMHARLKECAERHGLDLESFSADAAVIMELDKLRGIIR